MDRWISCAAAFGGFEKPIPERTTTADTEWALSAVEMAVEVSAVEALDFLRFGALYPSSSAIFFLKKKKDIRLRRALGDFWIFGLVSCLNR